MPAGRRNAVGARLDNLHETAALARDLGLDDLARQREGYEDLGAGMVGDAVALMAERSDGEAFGHHAGSLRAPRRYS